MLTYMCINMIVSCISICAGILRVCILFDYVQCCEDTVSVELRYISSIYYFYYESPQ